MKHTEINSISIITLTSNIVMAKSCGRTHRMLASDVADLTDCTGFTVFCFICWFLDCIDFIHGRTIFCFIFYWGLLFFSGFYWYWMSSLILLIFIDFAEFTEFTDILCYIYTYIVLILLDQAFPLGGLRRLQEVEGRGTVGDDRRMHFRLLLHYRWQLPAKVRYILDQHDLRILSITSLKTISQI